MENVYNLFLTLLLYSASTAPVSTFLCKNKSWLKKLILISISTALTHSSTLPSLASFKLLGPTSPLACWQPNPVNMSVLFGISVAFKTLLTCFLLLGTWKSKVDFSYHHEIKVGFRLVEDQGQEGRNNCSSSSLRWHQWKGQEAECRLDTGSPGNIGLWGQYCKLPGKQDKVNIISNITCCIVAQKFVIVF